MKKNIISILAILTILALTACSNLTSAKLTPYQKYSKIIEANSSAKSAAANVVINANTMLDDNPELNYTLYRNVDIKQITRSKDDVDIEQKTIHKFDSIYGGDDYNIEERIDYYYKTGYIYSNDLIYDYKSKSLADLDIISSPLDLLTMPFNQDDIKDIKIEKVPISETSNSKSKDEKAEKVDIETITLALSPETTKERITSFVLFLMLEQGTTKKYFASELSEMEMTFIEPVYQLTTKNGIITGCTLSCDISIMSEGEKTLINLDISTSDIRFDSISEIIFPTDLNDYELDE